MHEQSLFALDFGYYLFCRYFGESLDNIKHVCVHSKTFIFFFTCGDDNIPAYNFFPLLVRLRVGRKFIQEFKNTEN